MKKFIAISAMLAPALAFAQTPIRDVNGVSSKLVQIGNLVMYLLIALAVIFIVWNVVMYIVKGADPEAKTAHMKNVGWGILGLAIILSIWGLVNILTTTFKTEAPNQSVPQIGTGGPWNGANNPGNNGIPQVQ